MLEEIKAKVEAALPGAQVHLQDDSHEHAGHNASGAHLTIYVKYAGFEGKTMVEQHQMIYKILAEEMKGAIHALIIKTSP